MNSEYLDELSVFGFCFIIIDGDHDRFFFIMTEIHINSVIRDKMSQFCRYVLYIFIRTPVSEVF